MKHYYTKGVFTIQFPYNHKGIRNVQIEIGKDFDANEVRAKMTGGNVDETLAKGKQRAEDIANGKEKEGFFSKFFS